MSKRAKELVKLLSRLLDQKHLFNEEQLIQMKRQLRMIKEEIAEIEAKNSKGFGKK